MKKLVKPLWFSASFSFLEPMCGAGGGEERRGQNLEGGRSDLQVSFPDVLNEIKARVNYRKNLPKGTEYTIEKGSIARGEGRKLTRRPPQ